MELSRRDVNKQNTIEHIKKTFLSLYAKNGIDSITVSDLCKASGIAKSTFYLYYEDKYAVLESIENHVLNDLKEISGELVDVYEEGIKSGTPDVALVESVSYIAKNTELFKILLGPHSNPQFSYKWKRNIEHSFQNKFREVKNDPREAFIACTIFSASLISLYSQYVFGNLDATEEELCLVINSLFKYSLFDFSEII
ncbi:MAG: TetR/AcrR family transcriptional regulator [Lachnospiraceae bacterium]|nr:TetR/AcrR family transcriptional regulator [Lachnospiraceae bacterium]